MKIKHILYIFLMLILSNQYSNATTPTLPLWPHLVTSLSKQSIVDKHGTISHVKSPYLIIYTPQYSNHIAILTISGGGYVREEIAKESTPTSKFLQQHGFTVFELIYRLPHQDKNNEFVPFQDGQRAIRVIRSHASQFNIDPERIGVIGFSAGGHLAGMLATQWAHQFSTLNDPIDHISSKPNFTALLYPIISMQPPLDHTHAYKSLIGKTPNLAEQTFFLVNLQVNKRTTPIFLAHSQNDPIAPIQHSLDLKNALEKNNIPFEFHLFTNGGHGWGLGKKNTETTQWPTLFLAWLEKINIL